MNARLSEESRTILDIAVEESRKLHHGFIGTEHLLLALLSHPPTVQILQHFNLTPDRIREQVSSLIHAGPETSATNDRPFTPRALRAIDLAADEFARGNRKQIEPAHLFLGLFRESEGIAGLILRTLAPALTPQSLREHIFRIRLAQLRLIERTVRPIHAGTPRKLKMREELLAHLEAIYEQELECSQDKNPDAALVQSANRFGSPADLTHELQSTVPAHERLSFLIEKHFGWRAPEHASQYLFRLSIQFLFLTGVPSVICLASYLYVRGIAPYTFTGLHFLYPTLLVLLTIAVTLFLLGNLYFMTRDALFGVFGSQQSLRRVALLLAATTAATIAIGIAFMTAFTGSLHLSAQNFAGIICAAITAPILSLLSARFRGPAEIQQTHWECLTLDPA